MIDNPEGQDEEKGVDHGSDAWAREYFFKK